VAAKDREGEGGSVKKFGEKERAGRYFCGLAWDRPINHLNDARRGACGIWSGNDRAAAR